MDRGKARSARISALNYVIEANVTLNVGIDNKPIVSVSVSIGMPVYNGIRFIGRAIESLLAQTVTDFELIISDNCSSDGTWGLLEAYAEKDNRIRIYRQEHNIGAPGNFSFVLSKAIGKYFMWAADDDYWSPEFIARMYKELQRHSSAGVAFCAVERRYDDDGFLDIIRFEGKDNPNNLGYFVMMMRLTSTKKYNLFIYGLYESELLKQSFANMPETPGADRLFVCQMALATRFRYVNDILHIRTVHRRPSVVRLPNEKFNMMLADKFVDIKILMALCKVLYRSSVIPWHRKFYLPVALQRYAVMLLASRFSPYFRRMVGQNNWNKLRRLRDAFRS